MPTLAKKGQAPNVLNRASGVQNIETAESIGFPTNLKQLVQVLVRTELAAMASCWKTELQESLKRDVERDFKATLKAEVFRVMRDIGSVASSPSASEKWALYPSTESQGTENVEGMCCRSEEETQRSETRRCAREDLGYPYPSVPQSGAPGPMPVQNTRELEIYSASANATISNRKIATSNRKNAEDWLTDTHYQLKESTWDVLMFVMAGALFPTDELIIVILGMVNLCVQMLFIILVQENMISGKFNDREYVEQLQDWRVKFAHDPKYADSFTNLPVASAICAFDPLNMEGTQQADLLINVDSYLKEVVGFRSGQLLCMLSICV